MKIVRGNSICFSLGQPL